MRSHFENPYKFKGSIPVSPAYPKPFTRNKRLPVSAFGAGDAALAAKKNS